MARRGPQANLREQAVELLAGGDKPPEVAVALGITEDELRGWRKRRSFGDAVLARSRQMLREGMYPVFRRMIEQAEAGQAAQQNSLLKYLEHLETVEAQNSSDRWVVGWSTAAPPTAKPEETPADGEPVE